MQRAKLLNTYDIYVASAGPMIFFSVSQISLILSFPLTDWFELIVHPVVFGSMFHVFADRLALLKLAIRSFLATQLTISGESCQYCDFCIYIVTDNQVSLRESGPPPHTHTPFPSAVFCQHHFSSPGLSSELNSQHVQFMASPIRAACTINSGGILIQTANSASSPK